MEHKRSQEPAAQYLVLLCSLPPMPRTGGLSLSLFWQPSPSRNQVRGGPRFLALTCDRQGLGPTPGSAFESALATEQERVDPPPSRGKRGSGSNPISGEAAGEHGATL